MRNMLLGIAAAALALSVASVPSSAKDTPQVVACRDYADFEVIFGDSRDVECFIEFKSEIWQIKQKDASDFVAREPFGGLYALITAENGTFQIKTNANFYYPTFFLFPTVYRHQSERIEVWRQNLLEKYEMTSNEDGVFSVVVRASRSVVDSNYIDVQRQIKIFGVDEKIDFDLYREYISGRLLPRAQFKSTNLRKCDWAQGKVACQLDDQRCISSGVSTPLPVYSFLSRATSVIHDFTGECMTASFIDDWRNTYFDSRAAFLSECSRYLRSNDSQFHYCFDARGFPTELVFIRFDYAIKLTLL